MRFHPGFPLATMVTVALLSGCTERAGDERAAEAPADAGQAADAQARQQQDAPGTTTTFETPEEKQE